MALSIDKISFSTKRKELDVKSYAESLKIYLESADEALQLKKDIPIFIDTNILLKYYSISFVSRKTLLDFLKKYKKRIYITSQVQKEFIKNREDIIERFFTETLEKLEGNFKDEIKNKAQSYVERNKILFEDFPLFEKKINSLTEDILKAQEELEKEIAAVKSRYSDTKFKDEFLSLTLEMNLLDNLTIEDINFLKTEFDNLKKTIDISKIKNEISKPQNAFPGMMDIKEKPENPYGDYLIFHEILKFSKDKNCDTIFLTYDTSKGDWLKENKEPHNHYIQICYVVTKKTLFFFDAERFFNKHLKRHLNSLVSKIEYNSSNFKNEFILDFINLEQIIKTISDFLIIDNVDKSSLLRLVRILAERNYINEATHTELKFLINYRNTLIHKSSQQSDLLNETDPAEVLIRLNLMLDEMNSLYRLL
jgi:predicted nucleic acid-binding protein